MGFIRFIIILAVLTILSSSQASTPNQSIHYNLKDLQILTESKNYKEFFLHYTDIRPSLRKDEWQKMVISNGINYLKNSLKLKVYSKNELLKFTNLKRIELLQNNDVYSLYLNDLASKYFDQCRTKINNLESDCYTTIHSYWLNSNKDKDLGIKIGHFLYKKFKKIGARPNILNQFWTYIHPAVESESGGMFCKKAQTATMVIDKLFFEYASNSNYKPDFRLFSRKCWNQIKPQVKTMLFSENEFNRTMALRTLQSLKEVKEIDTYITAFYYLLDSPRSGKHFNNQWAKIEDLKQKPVLRNQLIEIIKKRNTLPDKIFSNQNTKLIKAIINVLNRNFPEYLDLYTKRCNQFYSAKMEFEYGNPTMYCRSLKSSDLFIKLDIAQQNNLKQL